MTTEQAEPPPAGDTTHFGFRTVPTDQKAGLVADVFHKVAGKYDVMNDVMSGGLHRLWKDAMINALNPQPGQRFLDVAGGTGDIAFRILDRIEKRRGAGHVTVADINPAMLEVGRDRALNRGRLTGLDWVCGDAENLPLPARAFDAYTIAFGIRNVTHIDAALAEAFRVLKPGGRFLCLEFSQVTLPGLDRIYDRYSMKLIPWFGEIIAKDRDSYQYLVESIRRFPAAPDFATRIRAAGFGNVSWRSLSGGIVALHSGWRL